MTDYNHPITPPTELVTQWKAAASNVPASLSADLGERRDYIDYIATQAARWGADEELEACCEWFSEDPPTVAQGLRAARRPNCPSLQDQALDDLERIAALLMKNNLPCDTGNIRRALESLPD